MFWATGFDVALSRVFVFFDFFEDDSSPVYFVTVRDAGEFTCTIGDCAAVAASVSSFLVGAATWLFSFVIRRECVDSC